MPVFEKKKVSEDAAIWLTIIGLFTVIIFVGRVIVRTPPLLVAVTCATPIIGLIWYKFKVALFDEYEMKSVTMIMLAISFFSSIFIGSQNGKVESYFNNLLVNGEIVKYEKYVEAEEIYDGRKTVPPHYEDAYRFEPVDKDDWVLSFVEYAIIFICIAIPIINYKIFAFASKKADKIKEDDEYKRRRKKFIDYNLNQI